MEPDIKDWHVTNVSKSRTTIPLSSIHQAIGMLVEISKKEIGETLEFKHSKQGMISCTAGNGRSSISFLPEYDQRTQSLAGERHVLSTDESGKFYHADRSGNVSSISASRLVPILDAVRGLVYIFESHSVPEFLQWSEPVQRTAPLG